MQKQAINQQKKEKLVKTAYKRVNEQPSREKQNEVALGLLNFMLGWKACEQSQKERK